MKMIVNAAALIALLALSPLVLADGPIKAELASQHAGEDSVVVGTVANVFTSGKGNTFLNFCAPYPRQCFSAVIFSASTDLFPSVDALAGKVVRVQGRIQIYRGKPEIILREPGQLSQ